MKNKFITFLVSFCMIFCFSSIAFADPAPGNVEPNSAKIHGVSYAKGSNVENGEYTGQIIESKGSWILVNCERLDENCKVIVKENENTYQFDIEKHGKGNAQGKGQTEYWAKNIENITPPPIQEEEPKPEPEIPTVDPEPGQEPEIPPVDPKPGQEPEIPTVDPEPIIPIPVPIPDPEPVPTPPAIVDPIPVPTPAPTEPIAEEIVEDKPVPEKKEEIKKEDSIDADDFGSDNREDMKYPYDRCPNDVPKTADESAILQYFIILIVLSAGLGGLIYYYKKDIFN